MHHGSNSDSKTLFTYTECFTLLLWYINTAGMAISFAMGMQNSVTSNFTPMVIRTSHVSGTVLDIGLALGQCIRMRNLDNFWKVKFHLPNYLAFWVGALVGCIAYNHWVSPPPLFFFSIESILFDYTFTYKHASGVCVCVQERFATNFIIHSNC